MLHSILKKPDCRPAVTLDDVQNASIIDLKAPDVEGVEKIVGYSKR